MENITKTTMMHVAGEVAIIGAISFVFVKKISSLNSKIEVLEQTVKTLEEECKKNKTEGGGLNQEQLSQFQQQTSQHINNLYSAIRQLANNLPPQNNDKEGGEHQNNNQQVKQHNNQQHNNQQLKQKSHQQNSNNLQQLGQKLTESKQQNNNQQNESIIHNRIQRSFSISLIPPPHNNHNDHNDLYENKVEVIDEEEEPSFEELDEELKEELEELESKENEESKEPELKEELESKEDREYDLKNNSSSIIDTLESPPLEFINQKNKKLSINKKKK
jgi:hypothetical protein